MMQHAVPFLPALLQQGERRLKGKELMIPVVVGTVAFYLGKKASGLAGRLRQDQHF